MPEVFRSIPEVTPSVCPAAIVVVNVPELLIALTLIELGTLAAAATATFVPGVVKSAA